MAVAGQSSTPPIWTTIAATGIVDEADIGIHVFNNTGTVSIREAVSSATLDLRYPVPTLAFNDTAPVRGCVQLRARLRDTGAGARVIVRLLRVTLDNGVQRSLGDIDSDEQPLFAGNEYAMHQTCINVPSDSADFPIDTALHAYYVHAQLIKTTAAANPGLMAIQLCLPEDTCQP
jgi:hypothetical protein